MLIRLLRVAVLAAGACLLALLARAIILRVSFPYELEWMTGSVLDHVDRVRQGLPLYTAPTTRWIPFIYPPLYCWIAALLPDSAAACRLLSVAAALVQGLCVERLARTAGATPFWRAVGALLFFGCFFYLGHWYDLERSDTLCLALVLVGTCLLVEARSTGVIAAAGFILGLAFFAKQQAVAFWAAGAVTLALQGRWRDASLFAAAGAAVLVGLTVALDARSGGWFSYYVLKLPAAHGMSLGLLHELWSYDLPRGAVLLAATGAWVAIAARRRRPQDLVLAGMLLAGAAAALSSRLHVGGWINVLQAWTSFACIAVALVGSSVEIWLRGRRLAMAGTALLLGAVLLQLALWIPDPRSRVPTSALRASTERFLSLVRRLEAEGEVLVVGRGHVTSQAHFQMSGLADVARGDRVPTDLVDALRTRRLAAIIDDARLPGDPPLGLWPPVMLEDLPELRLALFANYFVAARVGDAIGRLAMPAPALPRWIYLPRAHPLDGLTEGEVVRRHFAELRLSRERAELRERAGLELAPEREIEDRAAALFASKP